MCIPVLSYLVREAVLEAELRIFAKKEMELSTLQHHIAQSAALLLYFYSDHCAPCISLRPKVQKMIQDDFTEMQIILVNSEDYPEITANYGVFSNPTLVVFFEGKEFQRWSKFVAVSQIASALERPYALMFGS